jgi:DNA-directed RNA polymerase specialized sigma24 family protein
MPSLVYSNEDKREGAMDKAQRREFEAFVQEVEPRLRRALVAAYGFERGRDATADALGWAWEHWGRINPMKNKVAYLFRVGQSKSRRRKTPVTFAVHDHIEPWFEPGLRPALAALSQRQRMAVVLIYGFDWTLRQVAELTGTRVSTVQTHLERGLHNLRKEMKVTDYA